MDVGLSELVLHLGESVALVGPNGAGKSTLLRLLTGDLAATEGRIVLNGLRVGRDGSYRAGIGVVPQRNNLDNNFRVRELLVYHLRFFGWSRRSCADAVDQVMAAVRIEHLADRWARELSGGESRRVAIARALAHSPSVLFLDEVSAGLDIDSRQEIWAVVAELKRSCQIALVFVSHDMSEVEAFGDHITLMNAGLPAMSCSVEEFAREYADFTLVEFRTDRPTEDHILRPIATHLKAEFSQSGRALGRLWVRGDRPTAGAELIECLASQGFRTLTVEVKGPSLDVAYMRSMHVLKLAS